LKCLTPNSPGNQPCWIFQRAWGFWGRRHDSGREKNPSAEGGDFRVKFRREHRKVTIRVWAPFSPIQKGVVPECGWTVTPAPKKVPKRDRGREKHHAKQQFLRGSRCVRRERGEKLGVFPVKIPISDSQRGAGWERRLKGENSSTETKRALEDLSMRAPPHVTGNLIKRGGWGGGGVPFGGSLKISR